MRDKTINISLEIKCPNCGAVNREYIRTGVNISNGMVPQTIFKCEKCKELVTANSHLDLDVWVKDPNSVASDWEYPKQT